MCGPRATTMIPVLSESSFADTAGSIATTILVKSLERLTVADKIVYRPISSAQSVEFIFKKFLVTTVTVLLELCVGLDSHRFLLGSDLIVLADRLRPTLVTAVRTL